MHLLSSLAVTVALVSTILGAPASVQVINRAAAVGILPIAECPDDITVSVIVAPSLGGQDLAANQYVVCLHGRPLIFNCTEGLFFNWSTMSCDFPYERSAGTGSSPNNGTSSADGILDLIPVGPIQVPVSPQWPVPIWSRAGGIVFPIPPYPITKPDPSVIMPMPVLPAHPPPLIPRPVPYYYY